jgi:hypothetical protein
MSQSPACRPGSIELPSTATRPYRQGMATILHG